MGSVEALRRLGPVFLTREFESATADPEDVMRAIVSTPPKKRDEWRYLQEEA